MFLSTILSYLLFAIDFILFNIAKLISTRFISWDLRSKYDPSFASRHQPRRLIKVDESEHKNTESDVYSTTYSQTLPTYHISQDTHSMSDLLSHITTRFGDRKCMGQRILIRIEKKIDSHGKTWEIPHFGETRWLTYEEVGRRVTQLAHGLHQFVRPGKRFMMFEDTCMQWMLIAHACFKARIVPTTVYATLGYEALLQAVIESKVSGMFFGHKTLSIEQVINLIKCQPSLKLLILNETGGESKQFYENLRAQLPSNVKLFTLEQLEQVKPPIDDIPSEEDFISAEEHALVTEADHLEDDIALIMYTSGTTGKPKGVQMTHKNILSAIQGIDVSLGNLETIDKRLFYLAYLPLAHILELVAEHVILTRGAAIGYGTIRTLTDDHAFPCGDFTEFKPTVIAVVPKILETIKKKAMEQVNKQGKIVQLLFHAALQAKRWLLYKFGMESLLCDRLVFSRFYKVTGGHLMGILSGGSPLSSETREFTRITLGCPIIQGFGLTETCAAAAVEDMYQLVNDESVGYIVPTVRVKLVSAQELGYKVDAQQQANDLKGELHLSGPSISVNGYLHEEQKTKEDFTNGWFHTGDIARLDLATGRLFIIDRMKNLVKLNNGEYIAVEHLESIYNNSPFIQMCLVYADSTREFPVALVVPQESHFERELHISRDNIWRDRSAKEAVLRSMKHVAKQEKLKSAEQVRNIYLVPDEWSSGNGLLTPAQKLKRGNIIAKYRKDLDSLYQQEQPGISPG